MTTPQLPPLPEPYCVHHRYDGSGSTNYFTADQMRAYALAAIAAQAGWQPIETAPQGAFLVYLPDARVNKVQAARRHNGLFVIGNQFAFDLHEKPSHWMHEPHAPIKKEQEA